MEKVWVLRFSADGIFEVCFSGYDAVFSTLDKAMNYIRNIIENDFELSYDDNFIGYEKDDDYIYGAISNKNKEIITELTISLEEIL